MGVAARQMNAKRLERVAVQKLAEFVGGHTSSLARARGVNKMRGGRRKRSGTHSIMRFWRGRGSSLRGRAFAAGGFQPGRRRPSCFLPPVPHRNSDRIRIAFRSAGSSAALNRPTNRASSSESDGRLRRAAWRAALLVVTLGACRSASCRRSSSHSCRNAAASTRRLARPWCRGGGGGVIHFIAPLVTDNGTTSVAGGTAGTSSATVTVSPRFGGGGGGACGGSGGQGGTANTNGTCTAATSGADGLVVAATVDPTPLF